MTLYWPLGFHGRFIVGAGITPESETAAADMNYFRILLTRWSRRDWLAVAVIALVAALLVGTVLLLVTAGAQTVTLADQYETNATATHYDSLATAREEAGSQSVVLPTATATNEQGESRRVVGITNTSRVAVDLPAPPDEASGPVDRPTEYQLDGDDSTEMVTVAPGGDAGVLPSSWIRVPADRLNSAATGALVIQHSENPMREDGTPLVSVLAFFVGGLNDVVGILLRGVAVTGVIVAVTVSSVVRMVIDSRARTIRVARATGAPPRRIRRPLAARAGLLTAAGVIFGYAIGVILPNVAINVAVFLGLPTTLSLQVTPEMAGLLAGILGLLTLIGTLSGYLTARAATAVPVAQFHRESAASSTRIFERLPASLRRVARPTFLTPRTVLPATATLSAFAMIVLLVAALGGVGGSLTADGTTITDPSASHPVGSQVPESYAGALNDSGVTASPEILLFGYTDGTPYLARGAEYDSFAAVTGAELTAGRAPAAEDEAVVGVEAAETLHLQVGDELTMGGSTEPAVARVTIVGRYETGGIDDYQVLVPLSTARHLTTVREGSVNLIRTASALETTAAQSGPVVIGVDVPEYSGPNGSIPVDVTVRNLDDNEADTTVTATLAGTQVNRSVTVQPRTTTTVQLDFDSPGNGTYELAVGPIRNEITVTEKPPISLRAPAESPPGEAVGVRVTDATGAPVAQGTVRLANRTVDLAGKGTTRIRTPEQPGAYDLTVQTADQQRTQSIQVTNDAARRLLVSVGLDQSETTVHVRPTASVTLWNPWSQVVSSELIIEGPGVQRREQVRVVSGNKTTLQTQFPRRPPGEYTIRVSADGRALETASYRVKGDDRLGTALATSGHYGGGGGIGAAIEYAIGNLTVLLAALVALIAVTVVGAMSAVLSRALRANRQTFAVYRTTGATPRRIFGLVIADATRIGTVSAILSGGLALALTSVLAAFGQLTAFGIRLSPAPSPALAAGLFAGSLLLTLVAAVVVTRSLVRTPVHELLSEEG